MSSTKRKSEILRRTSQRSRFGATLTELLMSSLFIGVATAAVGELMVMTTLSATKMTGQQTSTNTFRNAAARITSDVRAGYRLGDSYGNDGIDFPATDNPRYGSNGMSETPSGGWPAAPWPSISNKYKLSPQMMIVQVPALFLNPQNDPENSQYNALAQQDSINGQPLIIRAGYLRPSGPSTPGVPSTNVMNLDTVVYNLVEDSTSPGEYLLQVTRFSQDAAPSSSTAKSPINQPQTIATRIVGPRSQSNPSGPPEIFWYYVRDFRYGVKKIASIDVLQNLRSTEDLVGVEIDMEVKRPNGVNSDTIGLRANAYLGASRNLNDKHFFARETSR